MTQEQKQLVVFSYGFPAVCILLAWRQWVKHGFSLLGDSFVVLGTVVLFLAIFNKKGLRIVFNYWMKVMHAIALVSTAMMLIILYVCLFTPVAIFLRCKGKDYLFRKRQSTDSYWINCEISQDLNKQF